jgi:mercuric ion transport protein
MKHRKRLITGLIGTFVVLLCCATPILVILLGTIGLGAITGYLDYVLIPVLAVFIGLTLNSYSKYQKSNNDKS